MKFLHKDINKTFLVLIIVFLVVFVSFTVYYKKLLVDALAQKRQNDNELNKITAQLVMQKLNNSEDLKEITLIDKAILERKYTDLVDEYENLRLENEQQSEELTLLKSKLEYNQAKIDGPVEQFRLIQSKNEFIRKLEEEKKYLCNVMKNHNVTDEDCG